MKKQLTTLFLLLSLTTTICSQNHLPQYKGQPWVSNVSQPNTVSQGLHNRHLSVTSSHGRYYDIGRGVWKWQRPNLFCTTEDLFTQTIVVPYLIPMLEKAGAVVFTSRERDWQREEIIVDNDLSNAALSYRESNGRNAWTTSPRTGFAFHQGRYADGENPFTQGTARMVAATSSAKNVSTASYQPYFMQEGRYAVYVSYQSLQGSVDDAHYTVYHKGQQTEFRVNQQMGGGTWVYLGTFEFDKGYNAFNRVVLTNESDHKGVVTADAVRFGGGMGNIERGGQLSGLPRCLEGSRYMTQWSGAPYSVVSASGGKNDYNDDINSRSLMTNWLAGGSCFVPNSDGLKVPIELSLAVHSDAGAKDNDIVGSLAICTTDNQGTTVYPSGLPRTDSRDFAQTMLDNLDSDIRRSYGTWNKRSLYDRNYSESRRPDMTSAILETMSHQNFTDMKFGLDPNFRFTVARSIYKTILRHVASAHGTKATVAPLQPRNFSIEMKSKNKAVLKWEPTADTSEPTAKPTSYIVYMATGTSGFDNGTQTKKTQMKIKLEPGVLYRFKVSACNNGGESFTTEELAALYQKDAKGTILIVNGFDRLAPPAVKDDGMSQGFDLDADFGLTLGATAGWCGRQLNYNRQGIGKEGPDALGYSGNELAGYFVPGNDFNYVTDHARAIQSARQYSIVSCSAKALESGEMKLKKYCCIDLLLGLQKQDFTQLRNFKAITPRMQQQLSNYLRQNGALLVSGSYVGSDMRSGSDQVFMQQSLKAVWGGSDPNGVGNSVSGLGTTFNFYRTLNEKHYFASSPDVLMPVDGAFCAMRYSDGREAAVAYRGSDCRTFVMGFPFECITDNNTKGAIMRGIMSFLIR